MSDGKLLLEAKEDMKKRGIPSPDVRRRGGAVLLRAERFSDPAQHRGQFQSQGRTFEPRSVPMPEVKTVSAILSNPSPSEPAGRVTIGRYILDDGLITMIDADGKPIRGTNGERVTHKLQPGEGADGALIGLGFETN
jgi:hypothetical protein